MCLILAEFWCLYVAKYHGEGIRKLGNRLGKVGGLLDKEQDVLRCQCPPKCATARLGAHRPVWGCPYTPRRAKSMLKCAEGSVYVTLGS